MTIALAAFQRHLASERGLSAHTVRAYLGDIASLLGYAADDHCEELADLDIAVLARLARQSAQGRASAHDDRQARRLSQGIHGVRAQARLAGCRSGRSAAYAKGAAAAA